MTYQAMSFSVLRPDSEQWVRCFERLPADQQDVFYAPSFAQLWQETVNKDDEVLCAAMVSDADVILYPFIKRNLSRVTGAAIMRHLYDATGLYGRGGLVGTPGGLARLGDFHGAMAQYCLEESIVCGFDRFHPVLKNHEIAPPQASIIDVGSFVVVDLRPAMDDITANYKQSVRKDLRKAERNGVKCFAEENANSLDVFLDIYYGTMKRNAATEFYYFPEDYFTRLAAVLPGRFTFFYAQVDGHTVSCELVLHTGKYCHSFLGGTRHEALPLCANPLLKDEIIRAMKARGCEYFLLGGGSSENDGISKYKRAFAPEGVFPSYVGGTIWDIDQYNTVRERLRADGVTIAEGRFQFYDRT